MVDVHIVIEGRALCGFSDLSPEHWPDSAKAVTPEEAHFANCFACISILHRSDEDKTLRACWPR